MFEGERYAKFASLLLLSSRFSLLLWLLLLLLDLSFELSSVPYILVPLRIVGRNIRRVCVPNSNKESSLDIKQLSS